jgi:hypothetical protein
LLVSRAGQIVPQDQLVAAISQHRGRAATVEDLYGEIKQIRDALTKESRRELIETFRKGSATCAAGGCRFNGQPHRLSHASVLEYLASNGQVDVKLYNPNSYQDWMNWLQYCTFEYRAVRYVKEVIDDSHYEEEIGKVQRLRTKGDGVKIERVYLYDHDPEDEYGGAMAVDVSSGVIVRCIPMKKLAPKVKGHLRVLGTADFSYVDRFWVRGVQHRNRQPTRIWASNDWKKQRAAREFLKQCYKLPGEEWKAGEKVT